MSESKVWILFDSSLEVLNRRFEIFVSDRMIDIPSHSVATPQVFFVSGGVGRGVARQVNLLIGTKRQVQSVNYALGDYVLHCNDVSSIRVDAISPNNRAGGYVE